jgi:hypothetical protein
MSKESLRADIQKRMNQIREEDKLKDETTITRAELAREMYALANAQTPIRFGGYFSTATLSDEIFDRVERARRYAARYTIITDNSNSMGGNMAKIKNTDTITFAELDDAITQLGYYKQGVLAEKLFSEAVKSREPVWKTGDIVRSDATGNILVKLSNGDWQNAAGGSGIAIKDAHVNRPLTLIGRAV